MISHRDTETLRSEKSENIPLDSIPQQAGIEVDEESDLQICNFQVSQKLGFEDGIESLNALQFHYDSVLNDEIQAMLANWFPSILDGNCNLSLEREPSELQLNGQRRLVNGFQKPWTKLPVNLDRRSYDSLSQLIHFHDFPISSLSSVPLWLGG